MNSPKIRASKHLMKMLFLFVLINLLTVSITSAQKTSSVLQGVVTDENKAIIPEAKLVLRDEKGAAHETISDGNGNFSFGSTLR